MAAAAQAITVRSPSQRAGAALRTAYQNVRARGAQSAAKLREKQNFKTIAYGGLGALGFGFLQQNIKLPGLDGVPNSLTYGAGTVAVGMLTKSQTIISVGTGPLFAGLHNLGLKGLRNAETLSGEFSADRTEGEFERTEGEFDRIGDGGPNADAVEGEYEEVTAGDFADL